VDVRSAAQTGHARSIAILIGVADADHTDHELRPVPATLNSLRAMQRVLTDTNQCGWPADRVHVLRNPEDAGRTARKLRDLLRAARDTLFVYYAGEADVTPSGQLSLALHDTEPDAPERTGLSYTWLARALRDCTARSKVVVLDCSLPGRAGQFLDPVSDQIAELSDVEGVYTLTSTTRHHPAPVMNAVQQRPRPTVFTGQLIDIIENGLPGGPLDLRFEDLYPALRQRLVSMGLPPPNQRGTGGGRPLVLGRNMAPRSAGAAAATATSSTSPVGAGTGDDTTPSPPTSSPRPVPLSTPSPVSNPTSNPASSPAQAPTPEPAAAGAAIGGGGGGGDAGPALLAPPDPAPLSFDRPGSGRRQNGLTPDDLPATGLVTGPTTGPTPVVGLRPITGQTPAVGARPIAGPEPPRRTPGSDGTPPPPPPNATPNPLPPSSKASSGPPAGPTGPSKANEGPGSGAGDRSGTSSPRPDDPGRGRPADHGRDDRGGTSGAGSTGTHRSRRMYLPALAAALVLLVAAIYLIRPSGRDASASDRSGAEVDLRDVGSRTISLGRGISPLALLQDGDSLWIRSGAAASSSKLSRIDLSSGEVVASAPFPESDITGTITAGAGSLWVTTASAESMRGAVVRIDPADGEVVDTISLPASPGRAVFTAGSLWVATVVQPALEEIGATEGAMSSAANALRRIDPETGELTASIPLDATPLDVRVDDGLVLVSTGTSEAAAVVAIDPATQSVVARIPVPEGGEPEAGADAGAAGPWMLFVTDPYAVRVDVDAEAVAAVTGPGEGIDMVTPNGDQVWELRNERLAVIDGNGDRMVSVSIDGTPLAATPAGRGAAWIAYRPSDDDEVLVTRVPAADLVAAAEDG
jgi:hypothetical protein